MGSVGVADLLPPPLYDVRSSGPAMRNSAQAAVLVAIRRELGMTQEELGEKLELSPRTLRRWEAGRTRPHRIYLKRIQQLLAEKLEHDKEKEPVHAERPEVPA